MCNLSYITVEKDKLWLFKLILLVFHSDYKLCSYNSKHSFFLKLNYLAYLIGFRKLQLIPTFTTFHLFDFRFVNNKKGKLGLSLNMSYYIQSSMPCYLSFLEWHAMHTNLILLLCIIHQIHVLQFQSIFKAIFGNYKYKVRFWTVDAFTNVQSTINIQ